MRRGGLAEKSFVENEKDFLLDKSASIAGTGVLSELLTWHFLIKVQVVRSGEFCRDCSIEHFRQKSPRWLAEKRLPAGGGGARPAEAVMVFNGLPPTGNSHATRSMSKSAGAVTTGGVQGSADSPTGRRG